MKCVVDPSLVPLVHEFSGKLFLWCGSAFVPWLLTENGCVRIIVFGSVKVNFQQRSWLMHADLCIKDMRRAIYQSLLSPEMENSWTICDPVHGKVTYPAYVQQIVDTPQFQRLRNLKQLGTSSKVFPSGTHTRFEHCLGVCHSAEKLLKILEQNSGVHINHIHRKCVILAGLLHDVGHGPFSHMWEDFVHNGSDKLWTHEQSSCDMARQLFKENGIKLSEEAYEHYYAEQLIYALITGNQEALKTLLTGDTMYLSEIVHNKHYKIDVDKWDYLLRDLFYLGNAVQIGTEFVRLFDHARVVRDDSDITHIGYRASDYHDIVALFEARTKLHIECYQHPTILGLEKLMIDALTLAEESGFRLRGTRISEAHLSPDVYLYLDDTIVSLIECSGDSSELMGAQQLLARIRLRQLYTRIHTSTDGPCDIEDLNKRFGSEEFFQVRKRIPYASQMAPRDVPLYELVNSEARLIDGSNVVGEVMNALGEQGFFEQYIVYCKSLDPKVINSAREYLSRQGTNQSVQ